MNGVHVQNTHTYIRFSKQNMLQFYQAKPFVFDRAFDASLLGPRTLSRRAYAKIAHAHVVQRDTA